MQFKKVLWVIGLSLLMLNQTFALKRSASASSKIVAQHKRSAKKSSVQKTRHSSKSRHYKSDTHKVAFANKYRLSSKKPRRVKINQKLAKIGYMRGIASYYGEHDGANGRRMANGELFNKNNIHLAAHPTLPLGTKLVVTNVSNGRQVYVEVTDRMPREGRVIDLSAAAASSLGMHRKGLAYVTLTKVDDKQFYEYKHYAAVASNTSDRNAVEENDSYASDKHG